MTYVFHPEAETELNKAVDYYNVCRPNLGREFAREIHSTIQNILAYPQAWTPLSPRTRRCLVHRFPYGVIYQVTNNTILIVAIMQLSRRPGYWRDRVPWQ
jgi:plasmid stabilization system protein ParE